MPDTHTPKGGSRNGCNPYDLGRAKWLDSKKIEPVRLKDTLEGLGFQFTPLPVVRKHLWERYVKGDLTALDGKGGKATWISDFTFPNGLRAVSDDELRKGEFIAVCPFHFGMVVLDLDCKDPKPYLDKIKKAFPRGIALGSRKHKGVHYWIPVTPDAQIEIPNQIKEGDFKVGDTRYDRGYAILWSGHRGSELAKLKQEKPYPLKKINDFLTDLKGDSQKATTAPTVGKPAKVDRWRETRKAIRNAYLEEYQGQWNEEGTQWDGPCPLCGGEDRFFIKKDLTKIGCRRCEARFWDLQVQLGLKKRPDLKAAPTKNVIAEMDDAGFRAKLPPKPSSHIHLSQFFEFRTPECIQYVLQELGVEIRKNVRSQYFEFRFSDTEWAQLTDEIHAAIRDELRLRYIPPGGRTPWSVKKEELWDTLAWMSHSLLMRADPFLEYLAHLPKWDENKRATRWLHDFFSIAEGYEAVANIVSRYILVSAVTRAYEPGYKYDVCSLLIGDPGLGKSTILRNLFPEHLQATLYTDSLSLNQDPKEWIETALPCVIAEFGEMAGLERTEVRRLNSFLSRVKDDTRLSYRRDSRPFPRRFILTASANDIDSIPNDPGGGAYRRFACVKISGSEYTVGELITHMGAIRDQLWAEALHLYQQGERHFISGEDERLIISVAKQNRVRDEALCAKIDGILIDRLTMQEIAEKVGLVDRKRDMSEGYELLKPHENKRLAAALRDCGWMMCYVKRDDRRVRGWRR